MEPCLLPRRCQVLRAAYDCVELTKSVTFGVGFKGASEDAISHSLGVPLGKALECTRNLVAGWCRPLSR